MRQYLDLLKDILAHGENHDDRTGVGTLSVFGRQIRFDLREGFPLLTTKKLPLRWIAEELFWFLSGSTDEAALRAKGVDIWKEWADGEHTGKYGRTAGDLGPVYGYLWRSFGGDYPEQNGYDQIADLLDDLVTTPNSRRLIVSGWHPKHASEVTLPPCHTLYQFKVHNDGHLSCHLYARSIDAFLGLPFNIASYALLTHLIAHVTTGFEPRELIISFGDVHIYKNHLAQVDEQLSRAPRALPELEIDDWHGAFKGLEGLLNIKWENLRLFNYHPWPSIKAVVAV